MQRSYDKMMFYKRVAHLMENPNLKFFSGKCEQISRKRTNYHKLHLLTPEITASRNRNTNQNIKRRPPFCDRFSVQSQLI